MLNFIFPPKKVYRNLALPELDRDNHSFLKEDLVLAKDIKLDLPHLYQDLLIGQPPLLQGGRYRLPERPQLLEKTAEELCMKLSKIQLY